MKSQIAVLFYTGVFKINKQYILCEVGKLPLRKYRLKDNPILKIGV